MARAEASSDAGKLFSKRPAARVALESTHRHVHQDELVVEVAMIDDPAVTLMDTARETAAPGAFGSPAGTGGVEGNGGIGGGNAVDMKAW